MPKILEIQYSRRNSQTNPAAMDKVHKYPTWTRNQANPSQLSNTTKARAKVPRIEARVT